jgi:DNA-directed RNA polymerase specialized sigma24 family protein
VPARPAFLSPAEEAEILSGARRGGASCDAAFDRAFLALREPVFALCLHLTGRSDDAEDSLRDAFRAVRGGLAGFRGESRLSTWVFRVALRASLQTRARRRVVEAGPLSRLPAGPRAVLALFAVDGLAPVEIADVLGVPENDVWSRLHSARGMLRSGAVPPVPRGRA